MSKLQQKPISAADLYPELTAEEQYEAEENLRRYLAVVKQIFEHIQAEKPKILTELRRRARLRREKERLSKRNLGL